jgi:hypothetical protein
MQRTRRRDTGSKAPSSMQECAVPWTDTSLDQLRLVGDPLADDTIKAIMGDGDFERVHALMSTLVRDDELVPDTFPPEVRAYLAADPMPAGVQMDRIERAQEFFQVWGLQISVSLFCASLPSAYAAAKGVKVLFETAQLQTNARRRVFETGQFLMDVMAPGGLTPKGNGIRSIQRVRLMHAAVRQLLLEDGTWKTNEWGVPINQEDLAGTMMSFSYVPSEPLRRLGIAVTSADAEDYIYTWCVIAEMLGVVPELRPASVDEAAALVADIRRRHYRSSPEGIAMTAALVELLEEITPHLGKRGKGPAKVKGLGRLVPVIIRHLITDEVADMIDVPPSRPGWFRWIAPLLQLLKILEDDLEHDLHVQRLIEPFARAVLTGMFDAERGGIRASFEIPESLARIWELSS